MYCKNCGNEINDDADVCVKCGKYTYENSNDKYYNESQGKFGVVMALFLGIIGLIIGIAMFPADTVARQTFTKAWGITFAVSVGTVIFYLIVFFVIFALTGGYYY